MLSKIKTQIVGGGKKSSGGRPSRGQKREFEPETAKKPLKMEKSGGKIRIPNPYVHRKWIQ